MKASSATERPGRNRPKAARQRLAKLIAIKRDERDGFGGNGGTQLNDLRLQLDGLTRGKER